MAAPGALQQGQADDGSQLPLAQSQERAPLSAEDNRQQEVNLRPWSSEEDQSRVYT